MKIKITYCPVTIHKETIPRTINNKTFNIYRSEYTPDTEVLDYLEVEDDLPEYGSDDLKAWLHLANHLNETDFINIYERYRHEESDKSITRWMARLEHMVLDVEEA